MSVVGKFTAARLVMSRVEVADLSAPFTLERGRISAPKVTGRFLGGTVALQVDADANQTPASTRLEMTLEDVQLAQLPHRSEPPPYGGTLNLEIRVQGRGDSLHALAAGAEGSMRLRVPQGTLRASLAELIGVDLRGLGLTLSGSRRETPVRCAAADFDIRGGVMQAGRLFIDSEAVYISGAGRVRLDSEMLDLELHGEPKGLRLLRLRAPVLVQGSLLEPRFTVSLPDSSLRVIDRGTPRDADCAVL